MAMKGLLATERVSAEARVELSGVAHTEWVQISSSVKYVGGFAPEDTVEAITLGLEVTTVISPHTALVGASKLSRPRSTLMI